MPTQQATYEGKNLNLAHSGLCFCSISFNKSRFVFVTDEFSTKQTVFSGSKNFFFFQNV